MRTLVGGVTENEEKKINAEYYKSNKDLCFRTKASEPEYQKIFSRYLYYILTHEEGEIKVLEIGPNSVTFELGVYNIIKEYDRVFGTDNASRVTYTLYDISNVAMAAAEEHVKMLGRDIFRTVALTGDALEYIPGGNGNYNMVVMNELLDDLGHDIVVRDKDGVLRVALYDIVLDYNSDVFNPTYPLVVKVTGYKEADEELASNELMLMVKNGMMWSFSRSVEKVLANVARVTKDNGIVWIHDYGMLSPMPSRWASVAKRLYATGDQQQRRGTYQLTSDINFQQVVQALSANNMYLIKFESYEDSVNASSKGTYVEAPEFALMLSAMSQAKKEKVARLLGVPEANAGMEQIVKRLNSVFKGMFRESRGGGVETTFDGEINLAALGSMHKKLYAELHSYYYSCEFKSSEYIPPLMNIAAVKNPEKDFLPLLKGQMRK